MEFVFVLRLKDDGVASIVDIYSAANNLVQVACVFRGESDTEDVGCVFDPKLSSFTPDSAYSISSKASSTSRYRCMWW